MNSSQIKIILQNALREVLARPNFTARTINSEWNIAHHYANAVAKSLPDSLNFDLDVIKPEFGNKRPDIIFHVPGINENNFLVIELKIGASEQKVNSELERVKNNWIDGLGYKFGAVINVVDGDSLASKVYILEHEAGGR